MALIRITPPLRVDMAIDSALNCIVAMLENRFVYQANRKVVIERIAEEAKK